MADESSLQAFTEWCGPPIKPDYAPPCGECTVAAAWCGALEWVLRRLRHSKCIVCDIEKELGRQANGSNSTTR